MSFSGSWHSRAVLAKGFKPVHTDSTISQLISYFCDKQKSGGGPLEQTDDCPGIKITESKNEAVVLFQSEKGL